MSTAKSPKVPLLDGDRTIDGRAAISLPEAAAVLGIGGSTAYAAALRGDIPTVTVGGRKLVPVRALNALLGSNGGR